MTQGKAKIWADLPTWAKGTIAVVSVLAIGAIGYFIYRSAKKAVEKGKEGKEGRESGDKLSELKGKGIVPTFSDSEAQSKVSTLVSSASDCDPFGSGATQIIAVIRSLKNEADWYFLNSAFGSKSWAECGFGEVSGSITRLLIEELDSGQMTQVRKHLSSINVNI
jgi:hypothetical protein